MKTIILMMLTIMMASSAMASKARLTALGQDDDGTLLFKDNRNIFLNPAQVVILNNSFNFEMGASAAGTNPNAEGGMIYDLGNGRLGLQLGRRSYVYDQIVEASAVTGIGTFLTPNNTIDVVYGWNKNSPWGVGVHYGSSAENALNNGYPRSEASELQVYGGMIKDKLEVYGQIGLGAESEEKISAAATEKYKGGPYLKAGMGYQVDDMAKVFGSITKFDYEVTDDTNGATEVESMIIEANYARTHKPKSDLMFFYGAGLYQKTGDSKTTALSTDNEELSLPVFLGLEGVATAWMDLRASVTQRVLLNHVENATVGDNDHSPNTTTVGAGASLKFTNFTVDATLAGAANGDINGTSLLANASVLYNF